MNDNSRISFDEFKKLNIRIGEILSAERIPDTDKLLRLSVDVGEETPRQIISGIAQYFEDPSKLVGVHCPFLLNLEPKVIRGHESNGMILAVSTADEGFALLIPEPLVPTGSEIR